MIEVLCKWLMMRSSDGNRPLPKCVARRLSRSPRLQQFHQSLAAIESRLLEETNEARSNPAAIQRVIQAVQATSNREASHTIRWSKSAWWSLAVVIVLATAGAIVLLAERMGSSPLQPTENGSLVAVADGLVRLTRLQNLIDSNTAKIASPHEPLLREARLIAGDGRRMGEYFAASVPLLHTDVTAHSSTSPRESRQ